MMMKKLTGTFLGISLLIIAASSCKSKSSSAANDLAKDIQSAVKEHTPGAVATADNGFYMKAKIDGREWKADYMIPDLSTTSSYKTVHGENGATYMNFQLWRRGVEAGKKIDFKEDNAANLSVADVEGFWAGKAGAVKITTIDEQWITGEFEFDATSSSSDKIIKVTEGSFRVPTSNSK